MSEFSSPTYLSLSLQRGLWGAVHPQLRQASIEADEKQKLVRVRFEYDGEPLTAVREDCACAATECVADFPAPWTIEEQHIAKPVPQPLEQLAHLVYLRAEA